MVVESVCVPCQNVVLGRGLWFSSSTPTASAHSHLPALPVAAISAAAITA